MPTPKKLIEVALPLETIHEVVRALRRVLLVVTLARIDFRTSGKEGFNGDAQTT